MYVKEYMSTNVITCTPDTLVLDAQKLMDMHNIRRLPVVDKGKLIGIITQDRIREVSPSPATSLTVWELNYLIAKMKIKDVMVKNVVTIGPDATIEEAAALGQKHRIGALPVVDKGKLVGIITTTDLFRIMTEAFGFGRTYARLHLFDCPSGQPLDDALELIRKNGAKVKSVFSITVPGSGRPDTIIHLEGDEGKAAKIQEALNAKGCKLDLRWH